MHYQAPAGSSKYQYTTFEWCYHCQLAVFKCDTFSCTTCHWNACNVCDSCPAGERQLDDCSATANRTCTAVSPDHYSAEGDNAQRPCFNLNCSEGTYRFGSSCNSVTGAGYTKGTVGTTTSTVCFYNA